MVGPIDTTSFVDTTARQINGLRDRLSELGKEISTKKKADLATTEPGAAQAAWAVRHEIGGNTAEIDTAETALRRSRTAEEALSSVKKAGQDVINAVISAPNDDTGIGFGESAIEARDAAGQILNRLNVDLAGTHLFAGTETGNAPMAQNVGAADDDGSPLGMTAKTIANRLYDANFNASDQVDDRGDALRVVAKGAVTADAAAGKSLNTPTPEIRNPNTDEVIGEVQVHENGQKLTVALDRDVPIPPDASNPTDFAFELGDGQTTTTVDGQIASGASTIQAVLNEIRMALTTDAGSLVTDVGRTKGGLDAAFRDDSDSDTGFKDAIYKRGNDNTPEVEVDGRKVSYTKTGDTEGIRDLLEGVFLTAVADKPDRYEGNAPDETSLKDAISREGVNELRSLALERMKAGVDKITRDQGDLGLAQRALEDGKAALETRNEIARKRVDELENVNRAAAITQLQSIQSDLQATYKTTTRLQQLSLARYI